MPANRREFNKQETVRHIRDVFMELYAKGGINGITVNSLCKKCGIAKSTFYLYFEDKYQVLGSVEHEILADLRAICQDLCDCDMNDVLSGHPLECALITVRYLQDKADTFRALLANTETPGLATSGRVISWTVSWVVSGRKRGITLVPA